MSVHRYLVTITVGDEVRADHRSVASVVLMELQDRENTWGVTVEIEDNPLLVDVAGLKDAYERHPDPPRPHRSPDFIPPYMASDDRGLGDSGRNPGDVDD